LTNVRIFKQRVASDHMVTYVVGEFPGIDKIRAVAVYIRQSNSGADGGIGMSSGNVSGRYDDIARAGLAVRESTRYQPAYASVWPAAPTPRPAFRSASPASPSLLPVAPERTSVGTVHLDMLEALNHQRDSYSDGLAEAEQYSENSGCHS
jgi:hypothetical protein